MHVCIVIPVLWAAVSSWLTQREIRYPPPSPPPLTCRRMAFLLTSHPVDFAWPLPPSSAQAYSTPAQPPHLVGWRRRLPPAGPGRYRSSEVTVALANPCASTWPWLQRT